MSRKPILHPVGNTNPKHTYHINGKELASFDNYRDLGVTVSFDLSWSNHILKITKRANSMLFLLNKVFCKSSPAIFAKLYKTYVRPVLEFANCVWTPVLQRDIQLLESVQRGATRVPFGRSRLQYTVKKKKKRRPGARLLYQIKECEIAHNHQDAWFAKN
jgi:hypothetical protein